MVPLLSRTDKMILKEILSPNENKASVYMSRKLEISMTPNCPDYRIVPAERGNRSGERHLHLWRID
jgi:hypothetical protein